MPAPLDAQGHLDLAKRNIDFYDDLRSAGQPLDWATTVLFYVALHPVLAHAAGRGAVLSDDHRSIRDYVARHLTSVSRAYRQLFDASRDARYFGWTPTPAELHRLHVGPYQHIERQLANRGIHW